MKKIILLALIISGLTGCISPIGKEEFTCNSLKKGGVCAGPRDIYEMTNDRESLEGMSQEEFNRRMNKGAVSLESGDEVEPSSNQTVDIYEPLDKRQNTQTNYQSAKAIPQVRGEPSQIDGFNSWPTTTEPLAPEPLAVIAAPKVMRVLVTAWKDESGNLNMPGYLYVQVQDEDWLFGEAANLRPTRVVPLEVRKKTQEELKNSQDRTRGVSPLGVTSKGVE